MPATSPQEIFDAMPAHFKPEMAGEMNAVIQFDLSGEGGGQWYVTIANGQANVATGTTPTPSMSFSATAEDYVAMINGTLNPMQAFMQGKIKIKGDMALAMKMQKMFGA